MGTDLSEVLLDLDLTEDLLELFFGVLTKASLPLDARDSTLPCSDSDTTFNINVHDKNVIHDN